MGVLDDAIREHLDLKRKRGAAASEVRELEQQAFGEGGRDAPPAGDAPKAGADLSAPPDLPDGESGLEEAGFFDQDITDAEPSSSAGPSTAAPDEDFAREHPAVEQQSSSATPPSDEYETLPPEDLRDDAAGGHEVVGPEDPLDLDPPSDEVPAPVDVPEQQPPAAETTPSAEPPPPGPSAEDVAAPEPARDLPAPPQHDEEPPAEEPPSAPAQASTGGIFDGEQGEDDELDELTAEDEFDSKQDDGDLGFQDAEGSGEALADEDEDEDEDSEDVLEETPEFLQDAPESDRLWFEQSPPKDFDFND